MRLSESLADTVNLEAQFGHLLALVSLCPWLTVSGIEGQCFVC